MTTPVHFDPERQEYRAGSRVLPRVSAIIEPLYDGAFSGIPQAVLERKRRIGTALHVATQLYDAGTLDESTVDPAVRPYLDGYIKAMVEQRFRWHGGEQPLGNLGFGFAGTPDRWGYSERLGMVMIDFKTVDTLHPAVGVQLAAYVRLIGAAPDAFQRYALQLRPDGEYRLIHFTQRDDDAAFMALLALHNWRAKRR